MAYYEVIPFKQFLSPDLGLFAAGGVVLLGLVVAEKFGYSINETLVRIIAYTSIGISLLTFVLRTGLWATLFL